ncbi:MAG: hypothetical protein U0U67_05180 [Chitinophagales bacterium]
MRFCIIIVIIFITSQSCIRTEDKSDSNTELLSKIDSLRNELKALKNVEKKDSIIFKQHDSIVIIKQEKPKTIPVSKKDSIVNPVRKSEKTVIPKSTVQKFYYKNTKRISVIITPWLNGKRTVTLFDTLGNETYHFDDVIQSYSNTTEIKQFHPNGAVAKINNHLNPGASMYWYDTDFEFDTNNEPVSKTEMRHPASLDDYMNGKSMWNKETKSWQKN